MPIEVGSYRVRVVGAFLTESKDGKPGLQLRFSGDDGQIAEIFWLSDKTLQKTRRDIITCGVPESQLQTEAQWEEFWSNPAAFFPPDHEVMIVTKLEEYKGEIRYRVQWINSCAKPASAGAAKFLASMFAGANAPQSKSSVSFINDQDLPF